MNILLDDNGYHLISNLGTASYDLNGKPILKIGLTDNFPKELNVTDGRSAPSPSDVTVEPLAFGVRVKWKWPVGTGIGWVANVHYFFLDASGEAIRSFNSVQNIDGSASASNEKHGIPVGARVVVSVSVTSPDGKTSKCVEVEGMAHHDASKMDDDGVFRPDNGRVYITSAAIRNSRNTVTPTTDSPEKTIGMNIAVNVEGMQQDLSRLIREQIIKEQLPGGLLHGR